MKEPIKEKFQVLVADDSANDRFLVRHAVERTSRLQIAAEVSDGGQAIEYLGRAGERGQNPAISVPDLLLLDLKMPVRDGFEVLEWLRTQTLSGMTVVVLTHSMEPDHIRRALDLGADYFQVKPSTHKDCVNMVLALEERLIKGLRTHPAWPGGRHAHLPVGAHHFAHAQ